jgi:hypothetical protein
MSMLLVRIGGLYVELEGATGPDADEAGRDFDADEGANADADAAGTSCVEDDDEPAAGASPG